LMIHRYLSRKDIKVLARHRELMVHLMNEG